MQRDDLDERARIRIFPSGSLPEARFRGSSGEAPVTIRRNCASAGRTGRNHPGEDRGIPSGKSSVLILAAGFLLLAALIHGVMGLPGYGPGKIWGNENSGIVSRQTSSQPAAPLNDKAGVRDKIGGILERYPESRFPYKIQYGGTVVPLELKEGEKMLGRRIAIWREFTGVGDKFRVLRVETVH